MSPPPHAQDPPDGTAADATSASAAPDPVERCVSCGAARSERFCAEWGERRVEPSDYTMRHVLGELAVTYSTL
jgi:hypothetical protein